MVIVILGILAVVAIPRFIDLREDAQLAAEQGVVGGVRAGIALWRVGYETGKAGYTPKYPSTLDDAAGGAASTNNQFFARVLDHGITDSNWSKSGNTYTGPAGGSYTYDPAKGTFD